MVLLVKEAWALISIKVQGVCTIHACRARALSLHPLRRRDGRGGSISWKTCMRTASLLFVV